jgi:hypothetical protein
MKTHKTYPAVAILFLLVGCRGPVPRVLEGKVLVPAGNQPDYRVLVKIKNESSSGEGEVDVRVKIVDPAKNLSFEKNRKVELKSGEETGVIFQFAAPEGNYVPEVDTRYPPG